MRIATTSDFGHWFRNDREFYKGCGISPVRVVREADPYTSLTDRAS